MHIGSGPEVDPEALAYEMISLLRSVRTPGGAVSAWGRLPNICSLSCLGVVQLPGAYHPVMESRPSVSRRPASNLCRGIGCDLWVKMGPI